MKPKWFNVNPALVSDPKIGMLSDAEFMSEFRKAFACQPSKFSAHIVPHNGRLPWRVWRVLRSKIFARDNGVCAYCGCQPENLELDHILPISKGGTHDESNLATACVPCNRSKNDRTPEQWMAAEGGSRA